MAKKKILIVDDDTYSRESIAAQLDEQYEIDQAESGESGLRKLEEQDFDVYYALEGPALDIVLGAVGEELCSGPLDPLAANFDIAADAGEDVGAGGGRGGAFAGEDGEGAEDGEARHGGLLGYVTLFR